MSDHPDLEKLDLSVREIVREVFRDPANGRPDNINHQGCKKLAIAGKNVWNEWRRVFPVIGTSNYARFEKLEYKDFSISNFEGFIFGDHALFLGACSTPKLNFSDAVFSGVANFMGTQFTQGVNFNGAVFLGEARFIGAQFGAGSTFIQTVFHGKADFSASPWENIAMLYDFVEGRNVGVEKAQEIAKKFNVSPKELNRVTFDGAHFFSEAIFKGRVFLDATSFGKEKASGDLVFTIPPNFHDCEICSDFSLDFARFPEPKGTDENIRSYRALKLVFSQQQAVREEQRFFRLEMAEEAKAAGSFRKPLYFAYSFFSDYGLNVWRPSLLLVLATLVAGSIYANLAGLSLCLTKCSLNSEWFLYTLSQALPLPGLDKLSDAASTNLFGKNFSSIALTATVILHKTTSLLALFLIGLGLRNLFKLK